MMRERIRRDRGDAPVPSQLGTAPGSSGNYRQESTDADVELAKSVHELAAMYSAADVVNRGAQ